MALYASGSIVFDAPLTDVPNIAYGYPDEDPLCITAQNKKYNLHPAGESLVASMYSLVQFNFLLNIIGISIVLYLKIPVPVVEAVEIISSSILLWASS